MLQALGYGFLDKDGNQVPFGAKGLKVLEEITDTYVLPELKECKFKIACDVTNALCGEQGCSAVFGPQKGATPEMIRQMDQWLGYYAALAKEKFPKADAKKEAVQKICEEAKEYGFASVCVNSYYTAYVAEQLAGTEVKVCTVVGFPLGQMATRAKAYEAACAVEDGAQEIDMVINVAALKDGLDQAVLEDIKAVKKACGQALLKVIIETCLLTDEEKVKACKLSKEAGADFVKTSTGFSTAGAKAEDVALMRKTVGESMGVKASGGIRDKETAMAMVNAGANRLGTSATVAICK